MKMRIVAVMFLFFSWILASNQTIKTLLNEIEKQEDLSLKTKQESAGISYVITRYQLDMMQARYLRDILKNTIIGYEISRYGVLDPWSANNLPYASNGIRIFIDNQEITTAKYDNGLFLFGNINLSFVDHIEIYYLTPSYKITTEPAYVIIKLYSKQPQRDEGKKFSFSYGTYGSNSQSFEIGNKQNYLNFSKSQIKHKKINIEDTILSRNNSNYHIFWTCKEEKTKYLLNMIYQKQEPFMGISMDGKLDEGYQKYKEAHFGFEHKSGLVNIKYTLDYMKDNVFYYEKSGLFIQKNTSTLVTKVLAKGNDIVNTLKVNTEKTFNSQNIIYGISLRNKLMNYYKLEVNDKNYDYNGIKKQNIINIYAEDNIQIKKNLIITLGYEFSRYFNDVVNDYNLNQYKIVSTYLPNNENIFKFSFHHIEYSVPPYLYKTLFGSNLLKPQKNDVLIGKYKKLLNKDSDIQFVGFYGINKNFPIIQSDGTLTSYNKNIYVKMIDIKYHRNYHVINDLILNYIYLKLENIDLNRSHRVILLNTHRYKKFDFFENIVYQNNEYKTNGEKTIKKGCDISIGLKYNYNENLTFSLKGENLLNSAYKNSFIRIENFNPKNIIKTDLQLIDRKVSIGMEYWF
ncbi:TonB-dependent receptor [Nautilia lithotrophica]